MSSAVCSLPAAPTTTGKRRVKKTVPTIAGRYAFRDSTLIGRPCYITSSRARSPDTGKVRQCVFAPDDPLLKEIFPHHGTDPLAKYRLSKDAPIPTVAFTHPKMSSLVSEACPPWLAFCKASAIEPEPFPANADDILSHLLVRTAELSRDSATLAEEELERLANLFVDGTADPVDVAHYIIFSHTLIYFDAKKVGRAHATSLQVTNPPTCRLSTLYFSLLAIRDDSLFAIAQTGYYGALEEVAGGPYALIKGFFFHGKASVHPRYFCQSQST